MLLIAASGALTSLLITIEIVPTITNAFGQTIHLPRIIQWVSTAPMMMFMLVTLDVRNQDDALVMWVSSLAQQLCVICGQLALLYTIPYHTIDNIAFA
jgi:bacteriorhodopsin